MKLISRLKFFIMRIELKTKFKTVIFLIAFLIGMIFFNQLILARFLPFVLVFIFLFLFYYFLIHSRNDGDSLGMKLMLMSLIIMLVMGFFINNLLVGVESYINHKYALEGNKTVYCKKSDFGSSRRNIILDRCISSNTEAEREANLINNITNWSFFTTFLLGIFIEVIEKIRKKREKF